MSDQTLSDILKSMEKMAERIRHLESRPIGIGDAPSDDLIYARKNKAWIQILGSTNVVDIIEANVSSDGWSGSSSGTFAHTIASGTNKLLIVAVAHNSDATNPSTISSVTWNGTNLIKHLPVARNPSEGNIGRMDLWYLVDPEEGTFNVVVTANGNTQLCALAADFVYVRQDAPFEDAGDNNYANNTTPTGTATGGTRALIFGALAHWNNSATAVVQAPATDRGQETSDGAWRGCIATSPSVDLSTPVDIDWTTSVNIVDWAVCVVAIAAEL
jgi:hypothetical protein